MWATGVCSCWGTQRWERSCLRVYTQLRGKEAGVLTSQSILYWVRAMLLGCSLHGFSRWLHSQAKRKPSWELKILLEVGLHQHILKRLMHRGCGQGPHRQWLSLYFSTHILNLLSLRLFPLILEYTPSMYMHAHAHAHTHTHTQTYRDRLKGGRAALFLLVGPRSQHLRERAAKDVCVCVCVCVYIHGASMRAHRWLFEHVDCYDPPTSSESNLKLRRRYKCWCPLGQRLSQKSKVSWHFPLYRYNVVHLLGLLSKGLNMTKESNWLRNRVADGILFSLVDATEEGTGILEKWLAKRSCEGGVEAKSVEAFLIEVATY